MAQGKLLIFSAPSGSGKSTLVKALMEAVPGLQFSVSATNRAPREGELNGVHYWFLSSRQFMEKVENNDFIEWEEVYEGRFYGTLKEKVSEMLAKGIHVVFDIDVMGGLNLKDLFWDRALAIFVMPPSLEILEQRLRNRMTESEEDITARVEKAKLEMETADTFDVVILNDDLQKAVSETIYVVKKFLNA